MPCFWGVTIMSLPAVLLAAFGMAKIRFLWLVWLVVVVLDAGECESCRVESWSELDGCYVSGTGEADRARRRDAQAAPCVATEAPPQ